MKSSPNETEHVMQIHSGYKEEKTFNYFHLIAGMFGSMFFGVLFAYVLVDQLSK